MATPLIPNSFLFRYAVRCSYARKIPSSGTHLVELPASCRVPYFSAMDNQPEFAELRLGWNEGGLGLSLEVVGKRQAVQGSAEKPTSSDGLSLWIDTRDTRTIHRASRFCQRFLISVDDGTGKPSVVRHPVRRALEEPPAVDQSSIRVARWGLDEDGDILGPKAKQAIKSYRIEVFLPAEVLHGFDPENNRRLGFFYRVRDQELGDQLLSSSREIPYWEDPSLWSVLMLTK